MKLQNKILLISLGIVVLIILTIAFATDSWPGNGFCLMAGLTGMCSGAGYAGLGALSLLLKDKSYAKGFLLSGGILLLSGSILFKFFSQY
jgi:hypothetical protein